MSSTARNCPHCGWHKSQAGTVIASIVALIVLAMISLLWYQANEADKAHAALQEEIDKADRMIKAPKP
jgi:hypothetical protein